MNWCTLRSRITFTLVALTIGFIPTGIEGNPEAKRLYDDLLSNYNRLIRPVGNNSDKLTVKMGLKLSQLIDVVRKFSESHRNIYYRKYICNKLTNLLFKLRNNPFSACAHLIVSFKFNAQSLRKGLINRLWKRIYWLINISFTYYKFINCILSTYFL